jgi:signal transduction histidine kinase
MLPPLPAAVEVAAFRIVQEALTNVVRHAQAHHCVVRLSCDDRLYVEISDDGIGVGSARTPTQDSGVGLISMQERAAELGGRCMIEPGPMRGTRVRASLPLGTPLPKDSIEE